MAKTKPKSRRHGPSVKDPDTYEALRREGAGKEKSARIANQSNRSGRSTVGQRGGRAGSYDDWTVSELRKRAAELGIEGRSSMRKGELIKAMRNR